MNKYNAGTPLCQIEETILAEPPYASDGGVCFLHVDKGTICAFAQLNKLFENYAQIKESAYFPMKFLIVCDNKYRAKEFEHSFFQSILNGRVELQVIHTKTRYY